MLNFLSNQALFCTGRNAGTSYKQQKKSDLKYPFSALFFFVSLLKHESLLAGTARPSRAHKWYSVLTGYASVNDLYINKESTTAWFGIWSPGLNPLQALALMILDCYCSQWQHWQGTKQKLISVFWIGVFNSAWFSFSVDP